ncbi:GTP cyclohydrolase I [Microbacterium sp. C448]|uniref:GTP cyclohydrolase I n=1 Tax=Microbacterium sp. C448 TaxID=1177594 RepID=UPI0009DEC2D2
MPQQPANAIQESADAEGSLVVIKARHSCIADRGPREAASKLIVVAASGSLRDTACRASALMCLRDSSTSSDRHETFPRRCGCDVPLRRSSRPWIRRVLARGDTWRTNPSEPQLCHRRAACDDSGRVRSTDVCRRRNRGSWYLRPWSSRAAAKDPLAFRFRRRVTDVARGTVARQPCASSAMSCHSSHVLSRAA